MSALKRSLGLTIVYCLLLSVLVPCAVGLPRSFDDTDQYDDSNDPYGISFNTMSTPAAESSTVRNEDRFIDLSQSNQCGKSASGIVLRDPTLNTTYQSEYGEFPWMTAIYYNGHFIAGGTLIRLDVVLTSKESIQSIPLQELQVVAGAWDLRRSVEKYSKLNRSVIDVAVRGSLAMLFLSTPFFNPPSIQPVCLPLPGTVFTESDCKTIGWSQPDTVTSQSDILWFRKNVVMPREDCESQYDFQGNRSTLEPGFFCAVDVSNDTSPLNSGAGLFCINESTRNSVMAGMALTSRSWNFENRPALFANISHYVEWIQSELTEDETN